MTKAVVAICVVLVPAVAVGAAGTPVKVGLAMLAFRLSAVVTKAVVASFRDESPADWVTPFVMPWSVVVEVPVVEPIVMFVVEPATPDVPRLTALVAPLMVAPEAMLVVPAAVELPKVLFAFEKVFEPPTVCVPPKSMYCWVEPFWRMNRPPVVVQMSPLTGLVGAVPWAMLKPALAVVLAIVPTFPFWSMATKVVSDA